MAREFHTLGEADRKRFDAAASFFSSFGVRQFTPSEITDIATSYSRELRQGLLGSSSSLRMIDTLLQPINFLKLQKGKQALVVEIGGTNVYGAQVTVTENGPEIISSQNGELPTRKFRDVDHFITEVQGKVSSVSSLTPDAVGIVYSFPARAIKTPEGVDVISEEALPKEFDIPGISQAPFGAKYVEQVYGTNNNIPLAVLNDTPAVLFSTEGARMGLVVGTGFNLALQVGEKIINTESGGFAYVPQTPLSIEVDYQSDNKGKQYAEKQVGGLYLEKQAGIVADRLAEQGIIKPFDPTKLTARTFTDLVNGERKLVSDVLGQEMDDVSFAILRKMGAQLSHRSAALVGTMIGSAIRTFQESFGRDENPIPVDGSVFWKVPGYREITQAYVEHVSGKKVTFINKGSAGIVGAAAAALSFVK